MNSKYQLYLRGLKHEQLLILNTNMITCCMTRLCKHIVLLKKLTLFATQEKVPNSVPKQRLGQRRGHFS